MQRQASLSTFGSSDRHDCIPQKTMEAYGSDKSKKKLYINTDDTHLKAEGAYQFAKLTAKELKEKNILTKDIILNY